MIKWNEVLNTLHIIWWNYFGSTTWIIESVITLRRNTFLVCCELWNRLITNTNFITHVELFALLLTWGVNPDSVKYKRARTNDFLYARATPLFARYALRRLFMAFCRLRSNESARRRESQVTIGASTIWHLKAVYANRISIGTAFRV